MSLLTYVLRRALRRSLRRRRSLPQRWRPGLDPQRYATPQQRRLIWIRQRGLCWLCHRPLSGKVECHHLVAWSRGGRTVLPNLVLVHKPCHDRLTAAQARQYRWRRAA